MTSLFDACADVVVRCPTLQGKAATYLPLMISQYILYKTCKEQNHLGVQRLVENWTHSELSLDFLSNSLCVRHEQQSDCFWEPNTYYGVFHENVELEKCLPSVLRGLFQNVYRSHSQGKPVSLQLVSVQAVLIRDDNVDSLCKLLAGEFPTTHPADYLSPRDAKALSQSRPRLPPPQQQVGCMITLHVNIQLCKTVKEAQFFASMYKSSGVFRPVIKGLSTNMRCVECFNHSDLHQLDYLLLDVNGIRYPGGTRPFFDFIKSLDYLKCLGISAESYDLVKKVAISDHLPPGLLVNVYMSMWDQYEDFLTPIQHSHNLEFLKYDFLSPIPYIVDVLNSCQALKVLSIHFPLPSRTQKVVKPSETLKIIGQLSNLEFFDWRDLRNLRTSDILSLHQTLCNSLPKLSHFHLDVGEYFLLSTTDLANEQFVPIMELLVRCLKNKHGDESCTTFRFSLRNETLTHWLAALRPNVCIKIGF